MQASNITSGSMQEGVKQSDVFVLFLSRGTMSRPYVHLEIREALELGKRIILLHETDGRFNPCDFGEERAAAPDDLKHLFDDHESLPFARRDYARRAMLAEMMKRAGPEYEEYLSSTATTATAAAAQRRRRVSAVEVAWQDGYKWIRLFTLLSVCGGAIVAVQNLRAQLGEQSDGGFTFRQ